MARRWSKEANGVYSLLRVSCKAGEQLQEAVLFFAVSSSDLLPRGRLTHCISSDSRREGKTSVGAEELLNVGIGPPIMVRESSTKAGAIPSAVLMLFWLKVF